MRKESEARRIEVSKVLKENLELVNAERKKEKKTTVVEKRDMFCSLSKNTDIFNTTVLLTHGLIVVAYRSMCMLFFVL